MEPADGEVPAGGQGGDHTPLLGVQVDFDDLEIAIRAVVRGRGEQQPAWCCPPQHRWFLVCLDGDVVQDLRTAAGGVEQIEATLGVPDQQVLPVR